ncbi:MAG: hypothetical protein ACLKAK_05725 [Alkaliphilus sp.]
MTKGIITAISIVLIIALVAIGYIAYTTITVVPTSVEEAKTLFNEKLGGAFEEIEVPQEMQSEFITKSMARRFTVTTEAIDFIMLEFDKNKNAKKAYEAAKDGLSEGVVNAQTQLEIPFININFNSRKHEGFRYVLLHRENTLMRIRSKDNNLIADLKSIFSQ